MSTSFRSGNRTIQSFRADRRKYLGVLVFLLAIFPAARGTGAGKSNISCQGTVISASDDIVSIINAGK